ncbi:MAG: DUF6457 domain-containing protein, partial [Acidimicrobiales bacterium]
VRARLGVGEALGDEEAEALLRLAKVVADASERRFAPLSCYLAGRAAADLDIAGRMDLLRRATRAIEANEAPS